MDQAEYSVYVLRNSEGLLYKGHTKDLDNRLKEHQSEGNWTKRRGPWQLVYTEVAKTKSEAMKREKFLKSGKGREFLKSVVPI